MRDSKQDLINNYLNHLKKERRLSANTVKNYARDLALLIDSAAHDWGALHSHDIKRIIGQLHSRGLSGSSLSRVLSAWRSFFRYLVNKKIFDNNPCVGIRAPKKNRRLPSALSPDELEKLLSIDPASELAVRDKAMFELCYSSGLRLSELSNITLEAIDKNDSTIRIIGKGNKTRVVPIGTKALSAIRAWLSLRTNLGKPITDFLFPNKLGNPISPRTIQYRLNKWQKAQGLTQNVHPHMLRHSFASHILQSSGNLRAVQEMLGHASVSTTQVYTHLDWQHLAKIYDTTHPRAKRKSNK